jgi:hypothetical protein
LIRIVSAIAAIAGLVAALVAPAYAQDGYPSRSM